LLLLLLLLLMMMMMMTGLMTLLAGLLFSLAKDDVPRHSYVTEAAPHRID